MVKDKIPEILLSGNAENMLRASALLWKTEDIFNLWTEAYAMYEHRQDIRCMAAYHLGYQYRNGKGVRLDKSKALEYFIHSAENVGIYQVYAMRIVGEMYRTGEGVEVNIPAAMHWLRQAAGHGNLAAQIELDELYAENTQLEISDDKQSISAHEEKYISSGSVLIFDNPIEHLAYILSESKNTVFFGGAGMSTESGLPDFRSTDGLYNQATQFRMSPQQIVSHSYFMEHTREFYEFFRCHQLYPDAMPNAGHYALARLEKAGKLNAVITQNIDGLHQIAGSQNVYELHGSVHGNYCLSCGEKYGLDYVLEHTCVPLCRKCGGIVRPDIVLYGENLNFDVMGKALEAIQSADALLIGGTSLSVSPAADMIDHFKGKHLVVINQTATAADNRAELVIRTHVGETLSRVVEKIITSDSVAK